MVHRPLKLGSKICTSIPTEEIDRDNLAKFDAGIAAGVGVDFSPISIGVRYNYGLTTVGKERTFAGETYTFPDARNSNLTVYLAYKLN